MKVFILFFTALLLSSATFSQQDVKSLILQKENLFWVAYNTCNEPVMASFLTDDIEFYHDKAGLTKGKDSMLENIRRNLCQRENYKATREEVKGSVSVYLLTKSGTPYGAILSGDHVFYINDPGKTKAPGFLAKFLHIWLLDNGEWKMARISSYDHVPNPNMSKR